MAAYRRVDDLRSPAGWLPVHRDQLRAQRSVSSMKSLYLYLFTVWCEKPGHRSLSQRGTLRSLTMTLLLPRLTSGWAENLWDPLQQVFCWLDALPISWSTASKLWKEVNTMWHQPQKNNPLDIVLSWLTTEPASGNPSHRNSSRWKQKCETLHCFITSVKEDMFLPLFLCLSVC